MMLCKADFEDIFPNLLVLKNRKGRRGSLSGMASSPVRNSIRFLLLRKR